MQSLLSERGKKRFITSKTANLLFMVMLFTLIMFVYQPLQLMTS